MEEPKSKTQYRVKNWSQYNTALKNRGSLTFWVEEEVLKRWYNEERSGKRGADQTYSDLAIAINQKSINKAIFNIFAITCSS